MISMGRELLQTITSPFSVISLKIQFLAIFGHFSQFLPAHGLSLDPTSAFIDITIITGSCCSDICKEKAAPGYYHPIFPPLACKIQFLAIFGHFSPFVPAHGQPLDPTSTFTNITIITGCCCNDIYGERATPDYYHSIPPSEAWKFNFWPFLAIFHHLCLLIWTQVGTWKLNVWYLEKP